MNNRTILSLTFFLLLLSAQLLHAAECGFCDRRTASKLEY